MSGGELRRRVEGAILHPDSGVFASWWRFVLDAIDVHGMEGDAADVATVRHDMEQRVRQRFQDAVITVDPAGRWHVHRDGPAVR
jgi:hypothetical protein